MAKAVRRDETVKLLGVARRNRRALMMSTALQAAAIMVVSVPALAQLSPNAHPTGGTVVGGVATIANTTNTTTIDQTTQRAAINWQSFNVGSQQTVQFVQPNASAIALNRVVGADPSQIAGKIDANGQIILENQSGVIFYKGAQVNTNGLMVTAVGITNQNFMAGNMVFDQAANPNARVVNHGTLTVKGAGLAALVAPSVANSGTINATMGNVVLAGAQAVTLDMYGDKLVSVDVTKQVLQAPNGAQALVTNTGVITANGGHVTLTAAAADGVVQNLVAAGGTISANTVGNRTGTISIAGVGGDIEITGQLNAQGLGAGTTGGAIQANTTGNVALTSTARVNASGITDGGTVAIGTTLARARGGASVTGQATAASVSMASGATVSANATVTGNGGNITVLSTNNTNVAGTLSAKGGPNGGNGGIVEVSGYGGYSLSGMVDVSAPKGSLGSILIDPTELDITAAAGTEDGGFTGSITAGQDTGTQSISVTTLDGFNGNVTLQATTTIDVMSSFSLTAGSLTMEAGSLIKIDTGVSAGASGSIILATGGAGPGTPPAAGASPTVNILGTLISSGGSISLLSGKGGAVSIGSGGTVQSASAAAVTIQTDTFTNSGTVKAPSGTIEIAPATSGNAVDFATAGAGTLTVPVSKLSAATLRIGAATINGTLVTTAGSIAFDGNVSLTGIASTLDLESTGAVTATKSAVLTVGTLTGNSTSLDLSSSGSAEIGTIGSYNAGSGNFYVVNAGGLTIAGPVNAGSIFVDNTDSNNLTINGSVSASASALLETGGSVVVGTSGQVFGPQVTLYGIDGIALNGSAVVGQAAGTLDLNAFGSGINEASTATLLAGTLQSTLNGANGLSGAINLLGTANAIDSVNVGTVAGSFLLQDTKALTATSIVTTGSLSLTDTAAGGITLTGSIGSGTSDVTLTSAGTIDQTGGSITAAGLALSSVNTASLTGANAVGTLAASISGSGNGLTFNNTATSLKVDTVGGLSGISTNNGAVSLTTTTSGDITLNQNIGAGSTVVALSSAGTIGQTGGSITASAAVVTAKNGVSLLGANAVGTIAATISASGSAFAFNNTSNTLTVDTAGGVTGITTDNGNVALSTTTSGDIVLNKTIAAGTGTIALTSAGTIHQSGGTVTAAALALTAATGADLTDNNAVGTLAASVSGANQGLVFNNTSKSLAVNVVSGVTGIATNNGTVSLTTTTSGDMTLNQNVNAGTASVALSSAGAIGQTGGSITAASLAATAANGVSLLGANAVGTIAGTVTNTTQAFSFNDTKTTLTVGTVGGLSGITTNSGNVSLKTTTSGDIVLNQTVNANSGGLPLIAAGNLTLTAAGGVSQNGAGNITANQLSGSASNAIALQNANSIAAFGAMTAGGIAVQSSGDTTIVATVSAQSNVLLQSGNGALVVASTGTVVAPNVTLGADSTLTLSGNALVGRSGAVVDLDTSGGPIIQAAASTIQAGTLQSSIGIASGATLVGTANAIASIGSIAIGSGNFTLVNTGSVGIAGPLTGASTVSINAGTIGVTSSLGATTAISLAAGAGGIALGTGHVLNAPTIDLSATGAGVAQTGTGSIVASSILQSSSGVTGTVSLLATANTIAAIGNFVVTAGDFQLADTASLNVTGSVSASGNIFLQDSFTGGTISVLNTGAVAAGTGAFASILADHFSVAGTVSAGTFEYAPYTNNTPLVFGSGGNLTSLTGISASTIRLGAVTLNGTLQSPTAESIEFDANFGNSSTALDLRSSGEAFTQGIAVVTASTLTGTVGDVDFSSSFNLIGTLGNFSTPIGFFTLNNAQALTIAGTVAAGSVLSTPNPGNSASIILSTSTGGIALGVSGGAVGVLNGGMIELTSAGTIAEANGSIVANTLVAAAQGNLTLTNTANDVSVFGGLRAIGGDLALVADRTTVVDGLNTGNNIFFEVATNGGTLQLGSGATGATFRATAAANPRITFVADNVTTGATTGTNAITATGGSVEVAPYSSTNVTLGGASSPNYDNGLLSLIAASGIDTAVFGQFTDVPNGSTIATMTGSLTVAGSLAASNIVLSAGALDITGIVSAGTVLTLAASSGGVTESGSISAATLVSHGTIDGGATLTGTNTIAAVGNFGVTNGDFVLNDGTVLTVAGNIHAGSGNIAVLETPGQGVTLASAGSLTAGGTVSVQADTLAFGAGSTITGQVFEYAPASATALTVGGGSGNTPSLTQIGVTALVRFGAVRGQAPTATSITFGANFAPTSSVALDLESTGNIADGATPGQFSITNITTLTGNVTNAGSVVLTNASNSVNALGNFTVAGGGFALTNDRALPVLGTVAAGSVLSAPNPANTEQIALTTTAGGITLGVSGGAAGVLNGGTVTLNSAGTISQPNGSIIANVLSASVVGNLILNNTSNQITAFSGLTATGGDVELVVGQSATLFGQYSGNNLFFEAASSGSTLTLGSLAAGATFQATAASNPRITFVSDYLATGATTGTNAITANGGSVEVAAYSAANIVLGGLSSPNYDNGFLSLIAGTGIKTAVFGQFTDVPNGSTIATMTGRLTVAGSLAAPNIVLSAGSIGISGIVNAGTVLLLGASGGGVTESGSISAATLVSLGTVTGGATLTGTNTLATLGNFAVGGGDFSLVDTGSLSVVGTISGPNISLNAGTMGIGGFVDAATVLALGVGVGGILETTGSITAGMLAGIGTLQGSVVLTGTNTIGALGNLASSSSVDLQDTGGLTVSGSVAAISVTLNAGTIAIPGTLEVGSLYLSVTAGGITESGSISATDLFSTGTIVGGATLTGSNTITHLHDFAVSGGNFTLDAIGNLGLDGNISGPNISLNAGTVSFELTGQILNAATALAFGASAGGISEATGDTIIAGTLASIGTIVGGATLTSVTNTIASIGSFAVSGGDLSLVSTGSVNVAGVVTAPNIALSAGTLGIAGTGFLNAGTILALGATAGGITESGSISAGTLISIGTIESNTTLTGTNTIVTIGAVNFAGTLTLDDTSSATIAGSVVGTSVTIGVPNLTIASGGVLNVGSIAIATSAGGVTETGTGQIITSSISIATTGAGDVSLTNKNNQILASNGIQVANGNLVLVDDPTLTLTNTFSANNLFFQVTQAGDAIALGAGATSATLTAGNGNRISIIADQLTGVPGSTLNAPLGNVEIAPFSTTVSMSLGGSAQLAVDTTLLGSITTGTLTIGQYTDVTNGDALTTTAANISIDGAVQPTGVGTLNLQTLGSVTEPTGALTIGTLIGNAAGSASLGGVNNVTTLGSFSVTSGSFTLADSGNTGNLTVNGPVTASSVTITDANTGTITVTGSIGTTALLSLAAGAGGLLLNTSTILSATTVDLSALGGGITEAASGTITATVLRSSAGVTGNVSLASTLNNIATLGSFAVTSGNFTLADAGNIGNLNVTGPISAANVTIDNANTGMISVGGSIGATAALVLASGSGGIQLNTGAILSGPTVDLSTTGGGITQVSTGTIIASTVLRSTAGVTGTVDLAGTANTIVSIGSFAVTSGDFTLADTGNLGVAGVLTAANVTLNSPTITVTGSAGATAELALAAGSGGIHLNTGEILSAATVDLSATGGGVTEVSTGTILASTVLQSTGGVTGTVDLAGTANTIASIGGFTVTSGDFTLTDTGNLDVAGALTAANITLNSPTITVTGSAGATTVLALTSGSGGIQLNTGDILSGATVDLSATGGGVTQVSTGTIIASTILQSDSGVTGTVNLAGVANNVASLGSFAVTGGDFTLVDNGNSGNLNVTGPVTAANVTIDNANTGTISIGGSLGAIGAVVLASGSGGIRIVTNGVLNGATVDLSTMGGGATEFGNGSVIASTVLQSASGVTGTISLTNTANDVASVGSFAVTSGDFTLVDDGNTGNLTLGGPITATNVTVGGTGTISVTGSVGATTALTLGTGTGGITLVGAAVLNAATVDLSTTGGGVTQIGPGTGSIVASAILQSSSGVTGTVNLGNTGNDVAGLGNFAVTGGSFTLSDAGETGNLTVSGPVTASTVTINSANTITATGSLDGTTAVTLAAGAGGISLASGAILNGPTVDLSATGGGVTQAAGASILASVVLRSTSGVTGTVSLTSTGNDVSSVGSFAVTGGNFALVDSGNTGNLTVTGPVTATNVSIVDANTGTITVIGGIGATTSLALVSGSGGIRLNAGEILSAAVVDLSATGGGVTQVAGGVIFASALTSADGVTGSVVLPSTANQIGAIAGLVIAGDLTVTNGQALALAGDVSVGSSGTVSFTTTSGGLTQAASGMLIAGIFTTDGGIAGPVSLQGNANQIGTLSAVTAVGALAVVDSNALTLAGAITVPGGTLDLTTTSGGVTEAAGGALIAATLTSSGNIAGTVTLNSAANQIGTISGLTSSGLTLVDSTGLTLANLVSVGPTGTMDITSPGGINQATSGVLIAGTLTSSGGLGTTTALLGNGNQIGSINTLVVASGTLSLNDSVNLDINTNGILSAHQITVTDPGHSVSFENGAQILTDGITRPVGALLTANLPTATKNTNGGAYFTVGSFQQTGALNASNLSGSANILRIDATGNVTFDSTKGLNGPNTWLILGLDQGAVASGVINVKALDITYTGVIGGASLTGSIAGVSGQGAAGAANIEPASDGDFKINACPIHSVICVLLTTQGIPQITPSNEIVFVLPFIPDIEDNLDIVIPLVSDSNDTIMFDYDDDKKDKDDHGKYKIHRSGTGGARPHDTDHQQQTDRRETGGPPVSISERDPRQHENGG